MRPDGFDEARQLCCRCDIRTYDAARDEAVGCKIHACPRIDHVEDDPVDLSFGNRLAQVADSEFPCRVAAAEQLLNIAFGGLGEVLPDLIGREFSARPHRAEKIAREAARSSAGLDDLRTCLFYT